MRPARTARRGRIRTAASEVMAGPTSGDCGRWRRPEPDAARLGAGAIDDTAARLSAAFGGLPAFHGVRSASACGRTRGAWPGPERVQRLQRSLHRRRQPPPRVGDRVQLGTQPDGARLGDQPARRQRDVVGRAVHAPRRPPRGWRAPGRRRPDATARARSPPARRPGRAAAPPRRSTAPAGPGTRGDAAPAGTARLETSRRAGRPAARRSRRCASSARPVGDHAGHLRRDRRRPRPDAELRASGTGAGRDASRRRPRPRRPRVASRRAISSRSRRHHLAVVDLERRLAADAGRAGCRGCRARSRSSAPPAPPRRRRPSRRRSAPT